MMAELLDQDNKEALRRRLRKEMGYRDWRELQQAGNLEGIGKRVVAVVAGTILPLQPVESLVEIQLT